MALIDWIVAPQHHGSQNKRQSNVPVCSPELTAASHHQS